MKSIALVLIAVGLIGCVTVARPKTKKIETAGVEVIMLDNQIEAFIFVATNGMAVVMSEQDCGEDLMCVAELKAMEDSGHAEIIKLHSHDGA